MSSLKAGEHCIFCKSTNHNYRRCPMVVQLQRTASRNRSAKQEYLGQSPSVFVGSYGYPRVNVGFLNVEEYTDQDAPLAWSRQNMQIPQIIERRTSLVNSTYNQHITASTDRLAAMAREVAMSSRPADMEFSLVKRPSFATTFNREAQPHGPNVPLKAARITENVKVDSRVERAVEDTDLKAGAALSQLYSKGFDEHALARLLSVGNLGVRRKLVPTRWSITATDDTLGRQLIAKVKEFAASECSLQVGDYLGNYYLILLYDDLWSYELYEGYVPMLHKGAAWDTDREPYAGRTGYARNTVGGYYAARLAILEGLLQRKRQAGILAIRFVTEEYTAPLGVWVVREAVRKAMTSLPTTFASRELMESYASSYAQHRFSYDIMPLIAGCQLRAGQRSLMDF